MSLKGKIRIGSSLIRANVNLHQRMTSDRLDNISFAKWTVLRLTETGFWADPGEKSDLWLLHMAQELDRGTPIRSFGQWYSYRTRRFSLTQTEALESLFHRTRRWMAYEQTRWERARSVFRVVSNAFGQTDKEIEQALDEIAKGAIFAFFRFSPD